MDEAAFTAIFDALPDPAMVVRAEGPSAAIRVIQANSAAKAAFRFAEAQPMMASVLRGPDLLDLVEAALTDGAPGEVSWETAGTVQDLHYRALVRPLPPGPNGAGLALVVVRDETDIRRNERMRGDFLANASHELKTPLASLQGFIETLRGHARDDPQARQQFLGIMAVQAERMTQLVADLLSLSRIELNEHIRPAGVVVLAGCVQEVVESLAPIAAAKGVTMDLRGEPPPAFPGDQGQVVQVAQNLIENAIKHSPEHHTVTISLETGPYAGMVSPSLPGGVSRSLLTPDEISGQAYTAIRVTNLGPGIARDHLPRLTERFYRAPGQKSGETAGTGLGLAIVKHILNRHRGGLFVETSQDRGAVFTAFFPAA